MQKRGGVDLFIDSQNSPMLPTTIAMSNDVSGSWDLSQINPLFKTNILSGEHIFVGRLGPEISSSKGNKPIWKGSIQKRTANR